MITESPLMLVVLALIVLSTVIPLIVATWVIYTIQKFSYEVHCSKTINVLYLKQVIIQVSQRTIILGLSGAIMLFFLYLVTLSQQFDFWILAYFPGCICGAFIFTFGMLGLELLALRGAYKYKFTQQKDGFNK